MSRRDFTKKPRSGQEDPPLREFPNYSVAPNQEENEAAEPLKKREETSREAQGWPREQMNGYGMHNVL